MKIVPDSMSIVPARGGGRAVSSLRVGDTVPARIIRVIDSTHALIRAGGQEFSAFFTRGVPGMSFLTVRFDGQEGKNLTFSIMGKESSGEFFQGLVSHLAVTGAGADFRRLAGILREKEMSLLELNLALLGRKMPAPEPAILRYLALFSARHGSDALMSVLPFLNNSFPLINFFYTFLRKRSITDEMELHLSREKTDLALDAFFTGLDEIDPKEREAIISFFYRQFHTSDCVDLLILEDGDGLRAVPVLIGNNSFLVSIDFSALGLIEMLFRKEKEFTAVSMYVGDDETKRFLDDSFSHFAAGEGEPVSIVTYLRKNVVDKLTELYDCSSFNSAFDRRF